MSTNLQSNTTQTQDHKPMHLQPSSQQMQLQPSYEKSMGLQPSSQQMQLQPAGHHAIYMPGLSYLVGPALMSQIRMWALISNLYQALVTTVTGTSMTSANKISDFDIKLGEYQRDELRAQGWSTVAAGGLSTAVGLYGRFGSDSELNEIEEQEEGAKSYKSMIDDEVEKGPLAGINERRRLGRNQKVEVEKQMNKLKNKEEFSGAEPTPQEKAAVKNSTYNKKVELQDEYREKVRTLQKRKQERMGELASNNRSRMDAAQALGQISTGIGNISAAEDKLDEQKQQAKVAVTDAAMKSVLDGENSHFRGQVDKMLDALLQIVNALNTISNANKKNG